MKQFILTIFARLGSIKHIFFSLTLSTMFMLNLSASQTDSDKGEITHKDKNHFTFPDWKNLHKLNTKTLESDAHSAWFDIYINTLAKKDYVEKLSLLPVGSIIVKPLYPDSERSETIKLTIMMKMEKGYDSEHNDWWYGVYDKSGGEGYYRGKVQSCIKCHAKAKETDYMFSESIMESITKRNDLLSKIKR